MPYLRTRLLPMALAGLLAAGVGIAAQLSGKLGGAEEAAVAKRFHLRPSHPAGGLAVVAIDDATFSQLDRRWPFPRSLHAAMVRRLHAAGARAIVYDIQFSEPTTPREDLALYRALGRTGGAVLAATEEAKKVRDRLANLPTVTVQLRERCADQNGLPLAISTLRGQFRSRNWFAPLWPRFAWMRQSRPEIDSLWIPRASSQHHREPPALIAVSIPASTNDAIADGKSEETNVVHAYFGPQHVSRRCLRGDRA